SGDMVSVQSRAGFNRAAGTAAHPLEYAAVLATTLPVIVAATVPTALRRPLFAVLGPGIVTVALMVSVSRSALVGLVVGAVLLLPGLGRVARRYALAGG